jgi:hypothetical protein
MLSLNTGQAGHGSEGVRVRVKRWPLIVSDPVSSQPGQTPPSRHPGGQPAAGRFPTAAGVDPMAGEKTESYPLVRRKNGGRHPYSVQFSTPRPVIRLNSATLLVTSTMPSAKAWHGRQSTGRCRPQIHLLTPAVPEQALCQPSAQARANAASASFVRPSPFSAIARPA